MKLKKILSSALLAVMIFTTAVATIPITADAAYTASGSSSSVNLSEEEIKAVVEASYSYKFSSAEEMLKYERGDDLGEDSNKFGPDETAINMLDSLSSSDGQYTIYVNRYTGTLYYCNNLTGQILTSNPYNYSGLTATRVTELSSQLFVTLIEIANSTAVHSMTSTAYSAKRAQISTEYISGGIRVNYTLGDTVARYLLPGRIRATELEEILLVPMLEEFVDMMEEYCAEYEGQYDVFNDPAYNNQDISLSEQQKSNLYYCGYLNQQGIRSYVDSCKKVYTSLKNKGDITLLEYNQLHSLYLDIYEIYASGSGVYQLRNLAAYEEGTTLYNNLLNNYYTNDSEIATTHEAIYTYNGSTNTAKANDATIFRKYVSSYSYNDMYEEEEYCGYEDDTKQKAVFRCSLEYTFNSDGTLSVRLPANSISFDETYYNLDSISTLKYFGAGDLDYDGYVFFPDGSGTIVEYDDFRDEVPSKNTQIYGQDYCYSEITGAHREQTSMPVFGIVSTEKASALSAVLSGSDTVTNGYFAILEAGESLANLEFKNYDFSSAYCVYSPYPSDKYDLSDTLSVGSASYYTIVSDSKFNGSYVTRYVMLADSAVNSALNGAYYNANYVGMADYYRDYLYGNGTLTALESLMSNLPLYIEALGAMEISDKFLTFPITKSIALTEFEDILTMYNELHDSASVMKAKYQALADAEDDALKKAEYQAIADGYSEFVIDNINFRLTGFGNGGLYATYPTKVRWNRACGGKKAFKKLLEAADEIIKAGENLGIYPEYDFMYLSYTEAFDGISKKNASRMIDNRYASKQVYDSVSRQYVSYFSLVVSPESLENLYSKFVKRYAKYDITNISVSTMGSDLNSNFDDDLNVNRDDAQSYVESILNTMANENGYDVMIDVGNIYAVRYASHILNLSIDSSHLRYSSYAIPFIGMVLHGSVEYTGTPINYAGTPAYDILRSIESGASLYYILCYQNSSYMKNDDVLSSYYGVDYQTWYENIVETYKELNDAIGGDLQSYYITNHRMIVGERVIEESEQLVNYELLMLELVQMLDSQLSDAVDKGYKALAEAQGTDYGRDLIVCVDKVALMLEFAEILNLDIDELLETAAQIDAAKAANVEKEANGEATEPVEENALAELIKNFDASIDAVIEKYTSEYASEDADAYVVYFTYSALREAEYAFEGIVVEFVYDSKYSFLTDSLATDEDYVYTDYTNDDANISLVTYTENEDGTGKAVSFILNYNIYSVTVKLDLNGDGEIEKYTLGKYEYVKLG